MSNDWLETMHILIAIGEIRNVVEEIAENWNNKNNSKETFEQLFRENKKLDFNYSRFHRTLWNQVKKSLALQIENPCL